MRSPLIVQLFPPLYQPPKLTIAHKIENEDDVLDPLLVIDQKGASTTPSPHLAAGQPRFC